MNSKKRVLFFTPYGEWRVHNQVDAAVAMALRGRGHYVKYLSCSGLYQPCAITRDTQNCEVCRDSIKSTLAEFNVNESPASDWLTSDDTKSAEAWIDQLSEHELSVAYFDDLPIGEWTLSTVFTHFRVSDISDIQHPRIVAVHKRFLRDALCTYLAITRVAEVERFDALLLFNGRFYPYRAAREAAMRQGLRILTHERGRVDNSFIFFEEETIFESRTASRLAKLWSDVPINFDEVNRLKKYFSNMLSGNNSHWPSFYEKITPLDPYTLLDIPDNAKIIGFFSSSSDEFASQPGFGDVSRQYDLIDCLGDILEGSDNYLVVRHHPNFAESERAPTEISDFQRAYRQALNRRRNVRIIMPQDRLSSYSLFPYLKAAIAPFSSIGAELTAFGIPTLVSNVSEGKYDDRFILKDWSREEVKEKIDFLIDPSVSLGIEELEKFYRRIYSVIFRFSIEFKSIGIKDYFVPISKLEAFNNVQTGGDVALDRVCDFLTQGVPVHQGPTEIDKARTNEIEAQFLRDQTAAFTARHHDMAKRGHREILDDIELASFSVLIDDRLPGAMNIEEWRNLPHSNKLHIGRLKSTGFFARISRHFGLNVGNRVELGFSEWCSQLIYNVRSLKTQYVLITSPKFQYHDASIAAMAEAVHHANIERSSIICIPGWFFDNHDLRILLISPEKVTAQSWKDLCGRPGQLLLLRDILSTIIIRKDILLSLLSCSKSTSDSECEFVNALFNETLNRSVPNAIPQPVFFVP